MLPALRPALALLALALTAACTIAPLPAPTAPPPAQSQGSTRADFNAVVARMRPVATQVCRERSPQLDCNFVVMLDDRPNQPPNAFHTRDERGRPIISFTESLIRELRSHDEIALIFGHEAAHHIADHIPRIQREAQTGALLGGIAAALLGADEATARQIMSATASVGARRYAKPFELEADRIGAVIAERGGYDALRGAQIFRRIPDPGNQFLGTHPPNAERLREVEAAVARFRAGLSV
ncbi:MAG: M48 family metalloprotease [Roseinatronobacter sp.]